MGTCLEWKQIKKHKLTKIQENQRYSILKPEIKTDVQEHSLAKLLLYSWGKLLILQSQNCACVLWWCIVLLYKLQ